MNPDSLAITESLCCIPRVSGDEPVFPLFPLLTNLYSPRERG